MSPIKEVNFLAYDENLEEHRAAGPERFPIKSLQEYEAQFAGAGDRKIVGEASPNYMYSDFAREKIASMVPNARLLIILRNPVDRLYSMYQAQMRDGRLDRTWSSMTRDTAWLDKHKYLPKVSAYRAQFGDRLKVMLYDDLRADTASLCTELFDWLGVDTSFRPETSVNYNLGGVPRNGLIYRLTRNRHLVGAARRFLPESVFGRMRRLKRLNMVRAEPMSSEDRQWLRSYFAEDIEGLDGILQMGLTERWN